jgi:hypothetical protein
MSNSIKNALLKSINKSAFAKIFEESNKYNDAEQ